jgi:hypothetical protein
MRDFVHNILVGLAFILLVLAIYILIMGTIDAESAKLSNSVESFSIMVLCNRRNGSLCPEQS